MQEVSVHSCLEAGDATCVVLSDPESSFYIPVYLEGAAAQLARGVVKGDISEEHAVMCSFMLQAWEQTDCALMFVELDYDRALGGLGASTVLYQKNEIAKKFHHVETPLPFALVFVIQAALPIILDEATVRDVGMTNYLELKNNFEELNRRDYGKET